MGNAVSRVSRTASEVSNSNARNSSRVSIRISGARLRISVSSSCWAVAGVGTDPGASVVIGMRRTLAELLRSVSRWRFAQIVQLNSTRGLAGQEKFGRCRPAISGSPVLTSHQVAFFSALASLLASCLSKSRSASQFFFAQLLASWDSFAKFRAPKRISREEPNSSRHV